MAVGERVLSPSKANLAVVGPFESESEFATALGL
jgi:hypothetical protein